MIEYQEHCGVAEGESDGDHLGVGQEESNKSTPVGTNRPRAGHLTPQVILAAPVLLILVALGLAIFGTIRLTRSLEPRQRVVTWFVFIVAVVSFFMKLVQMGLLGRATGAEP